MYIKKKKNTFQILTNSPTTMYMWTLVAEYLPYWTGFSLLRQFCFLFSIASRIKPSVLYCYTSSTFCIYENFKTTTLPSISITGAESNVTYNNNVNECAYLKYAIELRFSQSPIFQSICSYRKITIYIYIYIPLYYQFSKTNTTRDRIRNRLIFTKRSTQFGSGV